MAQAVEERFGGEVPVELDDLVTLPGVGRKTGNVVRSVWFDEPGPAGRHARHPARRHRLKLTNETDPVKIEHDLGGIVPPEEWGCSRCASSSTAARCATRAGPRCDVCTLAGICPSAGKVP